MNAATLTTLVTTYALPILTVILAIDKILVNIPSVKENSTFQVFNTLVSKVVGLLTTPTAAP
jgi:hypothetical protein